MPVKHHAVACAAQVRVRMDCLSNLMMQALHANLNHTDPRYQYLEKLDLSYIENYMCSAHYTLPQWSIHDARFAIKLYKRFLWLMLQYGKSHMIVPTKEIDEVWHNHILHTQRYTQDCQAISGQYIHHMPSDFSDQDIASLSKNFEITQELYFKEFNEPLPYYKHQD